MRWRGSNPEVETAAHATLRARLEGIQANTRAYVPAEKLAITERAIEELRQSGIAQRVLPLGAKAPEFELADGNGKSFRSVEALTRGRLVVSFYRGRWCPYCVAELESLQAVLPQVQDVGASLVAISPQTPKHSGFTADQHELRFPVLSDPGNGVARRFGLVYRLPQELEQLYRGIFINLPNSNGDQSWELPLPATFILERDGTVLYASADVDHMRRTEPAEIVHWLSHQRGKVK
ncbi:MAG: AhpC/TSA family protein [Acidobacteriota bacterium]|nr:AhpC/TSA family protein [Acidobacteriota bacterium]